MVIAFATSRPGEPLTDFRHRLSASDYYSRTRGLELVLDREAAVELVRLMIPVVGRIKIGLLIDIVISNRLHVGDEEQDLLRVTH